MGNIPHARLHPVQDPFKQLLIEHEGKLGQRYPFAASMMFQPSWTTAMKDIGAEARGLPIAPALPQRSHFACVEQIQRKLTSHRPLANAPIQAMLD
jgi:hypothetical protein